MGHLIIESKGEIDINVFSIIGASTKTEDDTKIGEFGSGLNYAIAILLRLDIPFKVFSGTEQIDIATQTQIIREKEFSIITVNGKSTGIATTLGKDWQPWMAIREIYSNAIDEKEYNVIKTDESVDIKGKEGWTRFYIDVQNNELTDVVKNWKLYFCNETPVAYREEKEGKVTSVYYADTDGLVVFKNGIRVYHDPSSISVFNYNFSDIQINEMRMVSDTYDLRVRIKNVICNAPTNLIQYFLENATENSFESYLNYDNAVFDKSWEEISNKTHLISENYYKAFKEKLKDDQYTIVPTNLFIGLRSSLLKRKYPLTSTNFWENPADFYILDISAYSKIVSEAIIILSLIGYDISDQIEEIEIVQFEDKYKDAYKSKYNLKEKTIYISHLIQDPIKIAFEMIKCHIQMCGNNEKLINKVFELSGLMKNENKSKET